MLFIWLSTQTGLHGGTFQLHGVSASFSFGFLLRQVSMEELFGSMESVLSFHLAFLLRRVSMKEPFSSMESVLAFHLAFYSDGSPWRNLSAPWSQ